MIPADSFRAFTDELSRIIKHAALTVGGPGKPRTGGIRAPRVNLPATVKV